MKDKMQAYLLEGTVEEVRGSVREVRTSMLSQSEVTIKVEYSSINFKDAMVDAGRGGMVRKFPHIPGIDLSGRVMRDESGRFSEGDPVTVTGHGVGVDHFGGYAEFARVPAGWVVGLPAGLDTFEASALGTAGLTSMLGLMLLERNGLKPGQGPVLVSGASGGVGSIAVDIMTQAGYEVIAGTGKADMHDLLTRMGAKGFLTREEMVDDSPKVLLKERWAAALDQAGGTTLEYMLRTTRRGGSVAVTGNVKSNAFSTTVLPFILRGVNLLGVDSGLCPMEMRREAWERLGGELKPRLLGELARQIGLEELPVKLKEILQGGARGRYVLQLPG